jgi:FHA domain/Protein of unknown function (DUF3662)
MTDAKDSVLDKAESLARRVLERLGSKVDSKLTSPDNQSLSAHAIGNLTDRIEQAIESNRKEDERGTRRVSPNRFKVLFAYEETSNLTEQYMQAVSKELTAATYEYIHNRRYLTRGPVEVHVSQDLFVKGTTVRASFEGETQAPVESSPASVASPIEAAKTICLSAGADGRTYRLELKPEAAPAYVGRAAGNAIRLDDPSVSRLHCSLSLRGNGYVVIADVGSANGTYVNEELLGSDEARPLKLGDIVGVGDFKLTVSEI